MTLRNQPLMIVALTILFCAGCSTPKTTGVVLPANSLNSDQLQQLFAGNTVESVTVAKERKSLSYYDLNGQVRQQRDEKKRLGQWRVTKRGRICLQMENKKEKCRIVVREGGTYQKYVVKKDGNHQRVVSYTRFIHGNPLGL